MELKNKIQYKDIVITGFSGGGGKTYFAEQVASEHPSLGILRSDTTRKMRATEVHGKDYDYITVPAFLEKLAADAYIEYSNPDPGRYYASPRDRYEEIKKSGKSVIFEVDLDGAIQLRKALKDEAVIVFLYTTGSTRIRLMQKRGNMSEAEMWARISLVQKVEMPLYEKNIGIFDKIVSPYNEDVNLGLLVPEIINLAAKVNAR